MVNWNCAVLKQQYIAITNPDDRVLWMKLNYNALLKRYKHDADAKWIMDSWKQWCITKSALVGKIKIPDETVAFGGINTDGM